MDRFKVLKETQRCSVADVWTGFVLGQWFFTESMFLFDLIFLIQRRNMMLKLTLIVELLDF